VKRMTIIDYGMGNLFSIERALRHLGHLSEITNSVKSLTSAECLILPGVGAFGDGIRRLNESGMSEAIRAHVAAGKPLLGICLGMQLLMDESMEFGRHTGLGLIPGKVSRFPFPPDQINPKIPNIGWCEIRQVAGRSWEGTLLDGLNEGDSMYFVHSYCVRVENPADVLATTEYGGFTYCSVIERGPICGCQFHPEKSGERGLAILNKFCTMKAVAKSRE